MDNGQCYWDILQLSEKMIAAIEHSAAKITQVFQSYSHFLPSPTEHQVHHAPEIGVGDQT